MQAPLHHPWGQKGGGEQCVLHGGAFKREAGNNQAGQRGFEDMGDLPWGTGTLGHCTPSMGALHIGERANMLQEARTARQQKGQEQCP